MILYLSIIEASFVKAQNNDTYNRQSLSETVVPIRPGVPGLSPFWNTHARQFIYAPAFNFKEVTGAIKYRYDITTAQGPQKLTFYSAVPYSALSPVWAQMPVGSFELSVSGLDASGKVLGEAGSGTYYRAAWFRGEYHKPVMAYDESARVALSDLLNEDYVTYWYKHKVPDPSYRYYRYPAKIMGALIVGAVTQSRLSKTPADQSKYAGLAEIIADYVISVSFKKGTPLEFFPPTYLGYEEVFKKSNPTINTNNDLTISAAEAGHAYLDLYDLTGNKKYYDAALRIAETYKKTQLPNGSWYLFVDVISGKNAAPNIAIPTAMINYFDRLKRDYRVTGLEEMTKKAFDWIMENPVKTFDWHGQFEDINARKPYENQSREQACDMAIYLMNNGKDNPLNITLAEDLIRFSEDQFVLWEKPVPNKKKNKNPAYNPENWITPAIQEQFAYWMPVGRAAAVLMETYRIAYETTKKDIYLAKAKSIANTFTVVQKANNGKYSTYFTKYPLGFWLNSVVYPAKFMMVMQGTNMNSYGKTSWLESAQPIRPGLRGKVPFWNGHAKRFIFAPAFDFKEVQNAKSYRFDIVSEKDGKILSFENEVPYAPLTPVWSSVPVGYVNLKVSGLDEAGKVTGLAGEKRFYRAAPFNGVYHSSVMPYDQSAKVALEHLLDEKYVQYWMANKKPDPNYLNYRYPAKIYSALVIGAVDYARLNKGDQKAEQAIKLAKIVADFMLSIRYEPGSKWEYFVPTYYGTKFPEDKPHMRAHINFTIMGVDAGRAFLDLYDYTKKEKYLQAAKAIAETYLKNQAENGSWHQFVEYKTNKPVAENIVIPTAVINYFDRLKTNYGVKNLDQATKKALEFIENNPMKTYNWQGQFEDVAALKPYVNLSREQACDYAIYLLNNFAGDKKRLADAEDLIRFAEDQFVIWEQPMDKPKKSNNPGRLPQNWILPSVQEQLVFWEPVGRSAGIMIDTYLHAYDKTGKDIYLAKAQSIGNSFTLVQQAHQGEYPTFFTKYKLPLWLNSVVYPAKVMIALQEVTQKVK